MDSILQSIKKLLGIAEDYDHFDPELIIQINTVFALLAQKGIGPEDGFYISGVEETWDELYDSPGYQNSLKTYIYLRVKKLFDPPQSSILLDAINVQIQELEWMLYTGSPTNFKQGGTENE